MILYRSIFPMKWSLNRSKKRFTEHEYEKEIQCAESEKENISAREIEFHIPPPETIESRREIEEDAH